MKDDLPHQYMKDDPLRECKKTTYLVNVKRRSTL